MRNRFIRTLVFLLIITLSAVSYCRIHAAETGSAPAAQKILFFPFANYTDSNMKYISKYLSELFAKNFKSSSGVIPLDHMDGAKLIKIPELKEVSSADRATTLELMKSAGAEYGVTGRYLIQGKTIVIESGVLKADGEYISCTPFEGTIDDRFFQVINGYTESRIKWIRTEIFKEKILTGLEQHNRIVFTFMNILKKTGLSSLKKGWSLAILIIIIFYIISLTASKILIRIAEKFSSRTETDIDDRIIALSKKPLKLIIFLIGLRIALYASDVNSSAIVFIGEIITSLMILSLAYVLSGIIGTFIRSWGNRVASIVNPRVNNDLVPLFDRSMKVVVFSIVLILILSRFNIDVAPLVASLGIAGFAIGFAVKDTLSNIIGGIILILDNSFTVGDKVKIDDDTGFIKEVGLRNTKILTSSNELIIIPNGELMNKKFKNYVLPDPSLRIAVNFTVAYGTDVDKVREKILAAVKTLTGICADPEPVVEFYEMADFSLNFTAKFWIPDFSGQNLKKLEAIDLIYKTLNSNGIEIPFPTNTVYLKDD